LTEGSQVQTLVAVLQPARNAFISWV